MALAVLLIWGAAAARAEMVAERGDVLLVSILEDPDLGREARVSADGTIMLPRLEEIAVAGLNLSQIRARIEAELQERGIIRTPTVIVEFAGYRPFYVDGDVAEPGAVPFEPGLTVRHALILAGGLAAEDAEPLTGEEIENLRSELRLSSYRMLQNESLIARLTAELQRQPVLGQEGLDRGLVPEEEAERILAIDSALLHDRLEEWQSEQAHRQTALDLVAAEIEILERQAELQETERQVQAEGLENARSLVERGLMPRPQLQQLQREASQLSRDVLDNQAFAARARQERATREHELRMAETEWRLGVQQDLREATIEKARLRSEIEALGDRLLALGLRADAGGAPVRPRVEVVIYRAGAEGSEAIEAGMETVVQPGDILEVTLAPLAEG